MVAAQDQIEVTGEAVCPDCEISLVPSTVIYDESGQAGLGGYPLSITRASDGSVVLVSREFAALKFDSSGAFAGAIGRPGQGPGEYLGIRTVTSEGDHIFTYDVSLARRTKWTLEGTYVSSHRIPGVPFDDPVHLDGGDFILSTPLQRAETIGLPLHRFTPDGEWITSFGPEAAVQGDDDLRRLTRLLAPAPDGTFWASHRYDYVLEQYSPLGEPLRAVRRRPGWFPRQSEIRPVSWDAGPEPMIRSIRVDERGLVWVVATIAGEDWRSGIPAGVPESQQPEAPLDYDELFDSIIEVIDPIEGTLVMSKSVGSYVIGFLDDQHIAVYKEDAVGIPIIEVFTVVHSAP